MVVDGLFINFSRVRKATILSKTDKPDGVVHSGDTDILPCNPGERVYIPMFAKIREGCVSRGARLKRLHSGIPECFGVLPLRRLLIEMPRIGGRGKNPSLFAYFAPLR